MSAHSKPVEALHVGWERARRVGPPVRDDSGLLSCRRPGHVTGGRKTEPTRINWDCWGLGLSKEIDSSHSMDAIVPALDFPPAEDLIPSEVQSQATVPPPCFRPS
jgi:hypothetical protein